MTDRLDLHPAVAAYVGSDAGVRAVLASQDATEPLVEAMLLLADFINGRQSANGAFLAAKRVDIRGLDADLCVLFLSNWAHASFVQSALIEEKREAAWTLVHRARTLISEKTPPEVSAGVDLVEAHLVGQDGNTLRQEELITSTLSQVPNDSPRRKFLLLELATLLAEGGRLTEIRSDLERLSASSSENFNRVWITAAEFVDHVECGRLDAAARLVSEIAASHSSDYAVSRFKSYRTLLELMRDIPPMDPDQQKAQINRSDLPDWALVLHCLLTGSVHQALRWARLCEKKQSSTITDHGCMSFNLVRSELAEGNGPAAERLLALRKEHGNTHYFDDLFLARIAWLADRQDDAVSHFAALLKSVDKHQASGRLDFELRLAAEIPRDALLKLTRTSETIRLSGVTAPTRTPPRATSPAANLTGADRIVGSGAAIASVRETIHRFANLAVPVLITGETGTGKELVARALHETGSRATRPFVAINCGAISDSLLESELFGHEKGAFSGAATAHQGLFEEAADGTMFLDEIGEISPRLQVVLLRVLETSEIRPVGSSKSRQIHCRILASTNANLTALADQDKFRRDILFRLRRLEVHLPALRERLDDIVQLAMHFLNLDRSPDSQAVMSDALAALLKQHAWPGNVRELRNTIERMRLVNSDKLYYDLNDIDISRVPAPAFQPHPAPSAPSPGRTLSVQALPVGRHARRAVRPALQHGRSRLRRLETLRDLFVRHRLMTRSEIIKTLDISPNTATQDLKTLCGEGFVEKVQPTASPRSVYFVLKEAPHS